MYFVCTVLHCNGNIILEKSLDFMRCVASRFGYPNYRLSELSLVPISSDNRRFTVCNFCDTFGLLGYPPRMPFQLFDIAETTCSRCYIINAFVTCEFVLCSLRCMTELECMPKVYYKTYHQFGGGGDYAVSDLMVIYVNATRFPNLYV